MSRSFKMGAIVLLWTSAESATVFASIVWGHKTALGMLIGLPFLGMGLILSIVSWYFLGSEKEQPVTIGPYAYSRHPFYIGLLLMLMGIAIWLGSLAGMVLLIISTGASALRAKAEERDLLELFPAEYRAYMERTAFVVGVRRYHV